MNIWGRHQYWYFDYLLKADTNKPNNTGFLVSTRLQLAAVFITDQSADYLN